MDAALTGHLLDCQSSSWGKLSSTMDISSKIIGDPTWPDGFWCIQASSGGQREGYYIHNVNASTDQVRYRTLGGDTIDFYFSTKGFRATSRTTDCGGLNIQQLIDAGRAYGY